MTLSAARSIAESAERLDNDVNGNPRYYIPFFMFKDMSERTRRSAGLMLYRGKRYGRGYVIQSYSLESDIRFALDKINAA